MKKPNNLVAKHAYKFNRSAKQRDKTKYHKKMKHKAPNYKNSGVFSFNLLRILLKLKGLSDVRRYLERFF